MIGTQRWTTLLVRVEHAWWVGSLQWWPLYHWWARSNQRPSIYDVSFAHDTLGVVLIRRLDDWNRLSFLERLVLIGALCGVAHVQMVAGRPLIWESRNSIGPRFKVVCRILKIGPEWFAHFSFPFCFLSLFFFFGAGFGLHTHTQRRTRIRYSSSSSSSTNVTISSPPAPSWSSSTLNCSSRRPSSRWCTTASIFFYFHSAVL